MKTITYKTPSYSIGITQDVVGFIFHSFLSLSIWPYFTTIDFLPTFEPNDYFWKHHWKEGEQEKWEAFAEACRQIMADNLGCELSDAKMEDKKTYKDELKKAKADLKKDKSP